jgi:hypothetical protein
MGNPKIASPLVNLFALISVLLLWGSLPACTFVYTEPSTPPLEQEYYEPSPYDDDEYFDELSYYGTWIDIHPYGAVWQPSVVSSWRPYHHGHWVWTDWGWTWISYEPFGWATYHYGFWIYDPGWGWVWIPGDEWSPVRVQWVWMDDYVCWTPLTPPGYVVADPWAMQADNVWVAVHFKHFAHQDLHRYTVNLPRSMWKLKAAPPNHFEPPTVRVVEKYTRRPIRRVEIEVKNVKVGKREYKKVVLPPAHRKTVESYKRTAEKKVFNREHKTRVDKPDAPPTSRPVEKYQPKQRKPEKQKVPKQKQEQKQQQKKKKSTKTKTKTKKSR